MLRNSDADVMLLIDQIWTTVTFTPSYARYVSLMQFDDLQCLK
jgi:hypothetical protein